MSESDKKVERLIFAMHNMMSGFKKKMDSCSAECGDLNDKEIRIVEFVGQQQNTKMSDLATLLDAPLSTVTSIVDKLVDRKFLTRFNSNDDRRVVLVTLASTGRESFELFCDLKLDVANRVLAQFTDEEQEQLISYLEKIPKAL